MADLCGGHPADVLIAVCLAAQTRTVPGMERAGSAARWMGRRRGAVLPGKVPGWRPSGRGGQGEGGTPTCALGHAYLGRDGAVPTKRSDGCSSR